MPKTSRGSDKKRKESETRSKENQKQDKRMSRHGISLELHTLTASKIV